MILTLCLALSAASGPTAKDVELKIRVIYGHNKATGTDPKLQDLARSLKDLKYTAYVLEDQATLKLTVGGPALQYTTPLERHLHVSAAETKRSAKAEQVRVLLVIPEIKFKTSVWISPGATLVVGGPKFEDGVLFFALSGAR